MKLEAIITCVGEEPLKFLKKTLPLNTQFFDNVIIITSNTDVNTQSFCKKFQVRHLITDVFTSNNSKFNRGAAINEALKILKYNDWICHLDADILLPYHNFRQIIENEATDIEYFYGCRRIFIPNQEILSDFIEDRTKEEDLWCPFGSGWGYFQLWNQNSQVIKSGVKYPESYDSAESDWKWRNLWGETSGKDDEIYSGNLKEISHKVWHLGPPNIANGNSFWN